MRFAIPYASILLVASFSCIWATPIAFNRDTLQRRSETALSARATEITSLVARGPGSDDEAPPTSPGEEKDDKPGSSVPKVSVTVVFTSMVKSTLRPDKLFSQMGANAAALIKRLHPDITVHVKPYRKYSRLERQKVSQKNPKRVGFTYTREGIVSIGVLENPLGKNSGSKAEDGAVSSKFGKLYEVQADGKFKLVWPKSILKPDERQISPEPQTPKSDEKPAAKSDNKQAAKSDEEQGAKRKPETDPDAEGRRGAKHVKLSNS